MFDCAALPVNANKGPHISTYDAMICEIAHGIQTTCHELPSWESVD